jgi:alpha-methylacyl-CoA racemase
VTVDGIAQPAPAPRFGRTPAAPPAGAPEPGEHTRRALLDWGFTAAEIDDLTDAGVVVSSS